MQSFTISLGQMQCDMNDMRKNENKITGWLAESAAAGSSLLVLPELCLTGYRDFDHIVTDACRAELGREVASSLRRIADASAQCGIDVLVGHPLVANGSIHIASSYIERGVVTATHRKTNLCNYAHYTEHLHFTPADEVTCAAAAIAKFGIIICEDSWHLMNAIVSAQLGAEVFLNPSAASVLKPEDALSCLENWKRISTGTAFTLTGYFALCNQAGPTGEGIYMGGSHVVDPEGNVVGSALSTHEALAHVFLDGELLSGIRSSRPLIKNERMNIYAKYCV